MNYMIVFMIGWLAHVLTSYISMRDSSLTFWERMVQSFCPIFTPCKLLVFGKTRIDVENVLLCAHKANVPGTDMYKISMTWSHEVTTDHFKTMQAMITEAIEREKNQEMGGSHAN